MGIKTAVGVAALAIALLGILMIELGGKAEGAPPPPTAVTGLALTS